MKVTYVRNANRWLGSVSGDLIKTKGITDAQGLRKGMSGPELHQILKDRI
ncbi:MAG: hypothetical protein ACO22Q_07615 [Burkholderiales bacterium]